MKTCFEYPYTLTLDEDGFWLAKCPDVRGAATDDRDPATAVAELHDALTAALEACLERGWMPLPNRSAAEKTGQTISVELETPCLIDQPKIPFR